ncbi:MAG: hypothetical protein QOJ64_502 [Acidobacteriota bacterium]|jgi:hypothetical protein|nr:hypothetical protein [Acidobacteriota bacterium]
MPSVGFGDSSGLWRDPESIEPVEKCAPEVYLNTFRRTRYPCALLFFTIPNSCAGDRVRRSNAEEAI